MKLYDFPRSSASYRVRIACNLKGLKPERILIDFRQNAQNSTDYLAIAPSGLGPALTDDNGFTLSQSLAVIRYLDRISPETLLIPKDPALEARVWELALTIACDIHPLNNLRVLKYLEQEFGVDEGRRNAWYARWIQLGFQTLETRVAESAGPYCAGASVTLADVCLAPQMFNARRFDVDLSPYPALVAIDGRLCDIPAFRDAAP